MSAARIGVVGGGLAGIAAALSAADAGSEVVLFERRGTLGGLTSSIERNGLWFDNGQHVFLRCCTAYRQLLERLGASEDVRLQRRLEVPVLAPDGTRSTIRRTALPAPLHLAGSLAKYRHLSTAERLRLLRPVLALKRLHVDDPDLDAVTFASWLAARGQSARAIDHLWNLIALPTINVPAADASLALAVKVFREGLLDRADAGDIGWSRVPLVELHGRRAAQALEAAGVEVRLLDGVDRIEPARHGEFEVRGRRAVRCVDAVIIATPPHITAALGTLLPADTAQRLGMSPIVNVHLVLDRRVTDLEMFAAVDSKIQFVFDRTTSSGLRDGQCLSVSLSAADAYVGRGSDDLVTAFFASLCELLPSASQASVVDGVVTRERGATIRGVPGIGALRPPTSTATDGLFLAGAWCDTGWPATMEGAVRSGLAAADAALAHTCAGLAAGAPETQLLGVVR